MLTGEGNFHVTGNILDIIGANGNLSVTHTIDSMWGNVGVQIGDKGYSDTQGMLGVKYSW
ncbi:autotransporter outer membrane beta-barrel domain-containing protein [Escherichia albertii]